MNDHVRGSHGATGPPGTERQAPAHVPSACWEGGCWTKWPQRGTVPSGAPAHFQETQQELTRAEALVLLQLWSAG